MAKKEGGEPSSPSRRDPRVYGRDEKTVIARCELIRDEPKSEESLTQVEASIPTEGEGQQQTQ